MALSLAGSVALRTELMVTVSVNVDLVVAQEAAFTWMVEEARVDGALLLG